MNKHVSRGTWLHDRDRARPSAAADPRPVEAAVLTPRADTMRDMVRQYVNQKALQDQEVDEEFLTDDEFDTEIDAQPFSDYQLAEMVRDLVEAEGGVANIPGEPVSEASAEPSEGGPTPAPDTPPSTEA